MVALGVIVFVVTAGLVAGGLLLMRGPGEVEEPDLEIVVDVEPEPVEVLGSDLRILVGGNIFWGRRTNTAARASELGVKYPFSGLDTLGRADYDAWIAGLECPVTDRGHSNYEEENLLKFNCDPDYLTEAAKYFSVVSLGNNHTDNQGEAGFAMTKQYLTEAGIQYFGHYDYWNTDEVCAPISLPVQVRMRQGNREFVEERRILVAFCGQHGVFGVPTAENLAEIKRWAAVMPVISMPHMGVEYQATSNQLRRNVYQKMIDYGSDMVLGDHPHWVQDAEVYGGRLIVYSMGNFMFDQIGNKEVLRAATIDAETALSAEIDYDAWDELAEQCLASRGDCLDLVVASGLPKITTDWRFAYHAVLNNGKYVTSLADETTQREVGVRLKWSAVEAAGLAK